MSIETLLTIFVLSAFVGFEVVSKVAERLHTPLMSGANAIHGIILIGAVLVAGEARTTFDLAIALIAVVLSSMNLVGGFAITDRMLRMFTTVRKPRPGLPPVPGREDGDR